MNELNDDFYSLRFDENAKYPPAKLKYKGFMYTSKNHGKHHHQYQCTCVRRSNINCTAKVYLPNVKDSGLSVETKGKHDRQCCVVNGLDPDDPSVDYHGKFDDDAFEEEAAEYGEEKENVEKENVRPNNFELSPRPTKIRAIRLLDVTQEMRAIAQKYATESLRLAPDMVWMKVQNDLDVKYPNGWTTPKDKSFVISLVKRTRRDLNCGDAIRSAEHPTLAMMTDDETRPFLQHNMTIPHPKKPGVQCRAMAWSNPELIMTIRGKPDVFVDATFDCAPAPFYQCLILMVYDDQTGVYLPVVYILMTHKLEELYRHAFHMITVMSGWKFNPRSITYDFERAIINAAKVSFPNATANGCDFHWMQAILRYCDKLKIEDTSRILEDNLLKILCVLPHNHVQRGIVYVREIIEEGLSRSEKRKWKIFWEDYFEKQWIPLLEVWSLYDPTGNNDGVKEIVNRTNNALEKYNRRFNDLFSKGTPSLAEFIGVVEEESRYYAKKLRNIRRGIERPIEYAEANIPKIPDAYLDIEWESDEESEDE
jgi:hypothetical protein